MGFNRPTWLAVRQAGAVEPPRLGQVAKLREQRARERVAAHQLEGALFSLAAILGTSVEDSAGTSVGALRDVVVHWTRGASYPPVTAIVVGSKKHLAVVRARWIELAGPTSVRLRSSAVYARTLDRHPADVALAHDVLDRQIVDPEGNQIVRPSDLYLATVEGRIDLIGIEVGLRALLRRLGPRTLRSHFRPGHVIDWATIRSFSSARPHGSPSRGRRSKLAGQAGSGLVLDEPAGQVRRLHASDIEDRLRAAQSQPVQDSR